MIPGCIADCKRWSNDKRCNSGWAGATNRSNFEWPRTMMRARYLVISFASALNCMHTHTHKMHDSQKANAMRCASGGSESKTKRKYLPIYCTPRTPRRIANIFWTVFCVCRLIDGFKCFVYECVPSSLLYATHALHTKATYCLVFNFEQGQCNCVRCTVIASLENQLKSLFHVTSHEFTEIRFTSRCLRSLFSPLFAHQRPIRTFSWISFALFGEFCI